MRRSQQPKPPGEGSLYAQPEQPTVRQQRERHLAQAEEHVRRGVKLITAQQGIVAQFEACCMDASRARALLKAFEEAQEMHVADRDRMTAELADDYQRGAL